MQRINNESIWQRLHIPRQAKALTRRRSDSLDGVPPNPEHPMHIPEFGFNKYQPPNGDQPMRLFLSTALVLAAVLSGCASTRPKQPLQISETSQVTAPEGHSLDDPMFQFTGTWEGRLNGYNAPHYIDGAGFSMVFRIVIDSSHVRVFQQVKGSWNEMKPGAFHMVQWGSQAIISSTTSGHDDDGTWVESSTFTLAHTNKDSVAAYWQRTVNNLDISPDKPYYQFAWGNSGEMHRTSAQPPRMFGVVKQVAQDVPVQELLGSPQVFDGKEVRVIGVIKFDFGYEGVSALYTSQDDLSHRTFSFVGIASVDAILVKEKLALEKLTGKFVLVEGVFHAVPRNWNTVCVGTCWPTGYLSNVHRVQAW